MSCCAASLLWLCRCCSVRRSEGCWSDRRGTFAHEPSKQIERRYLIYTYICSDNIVYYCFVKYCMQNFAFCCISILECKDNLLASSNGMVRMASCSCSTPWFRKAFRPDQEPEAKASRASAAVVGKKVRHVVSCCRPGCFRMFEFQKLKANGHISIAIWQVEAELVRVSWSFWTCASWFPVYKTG